MDTSSIQKLMKFLMPIPLNENARHYFVQQHLKHAALSAKYALGTLVMIIYFEWAANNHNLSVIVAWGATVLLLQIGRYVFATRALHLSSPRHQHLFHIVETLSGVSWITFLFLMGWYEQDEALTSWRCTFIFIIHVFYLDTMRFSMRSLLFFPPMICIGTCIYLYGFTLTSPELQLRLMSLSIFGTITIILYGRASYLFSYDTYKVIEQNQQLVETMEELLIHDELTQQNNRRYFDTQLTQFLALFKRSQQHFSIAVLDIDYFKRINDNYGHPIGDSVLIELSAYIKKRLRTTDVFARYGGEEFVILLPMTNLDSSTRMLDKVRADIEEKVFHIDKLEIKTTVSIGVTAVQPGDLDEHLLARADKALYSAKDNGRNKVIAV